MRHATTVRAELRTVLWQAAVAGTLAGLNAQLEHLGSSAAECIDVAAEDASAGEEEEDDVVVEI